MQQYQTFDSLVLLDNKTIQRMWQSCNVLNIIKEHKLKKCI